MGLDPKVALRKYDRMKSDRSNWNQHWQSVADLVLPTRDFTTQTSGGTRLTNKMFSAVAPLACDSTASALHGLLTNPAIWWCHVGLADHDVDLDEDSAAWLFEVSRTMLSYFSSVYSGFATNVHEVYLDLMAFGTAVCLMNERDGYLRFQARQLSNFYMEEDDRGQIIDIAVCMSIRARDLPSVLGFDKSKFSAETIKLIDSTKPEDGEKMIEVIHSIGKRMEYDPSSYSSKNMPWHSAYIEVQAKHLIDEGGLKSNPYLTPRWSKAPQETYGRSPAMNVLPAIKGINSIAKDILIASQLNTRPPINVPANGMEGPFRFTPGAINYTRAGTNNKPEVMVTSVSIKEGMEMLEMDKNTIEQAYFLDVLKLPKLDRMTAEEVITRRQQGLLVVSPMLSRLESELLDPAVTGVFNWMKRTHRITPPPPQIMGKALRPYYKNPMALSQRASESQNFTSAMQTANALLAVDPGVMTRNMDTDAAFRQIFRNLNNDPKMMRPMRQTKQIIQQQAQQQQAMAQASLAQGGAKAARDAGAALKDASMAGATGGGGG